MEKEDKIAFSILAAIFLAVVFGVMLLVKFVGASLFGWFEASEATGIGFKESFTYAIGVSIFLMVFFALFAGDGLIGELPTMLIGFFVFVGFFTFSIAWIF